MAIQFDGPNKRIYITPPDTSLDAQSLYSLWKIWAIQDDNAKFVQAMNSIGGDALSSTKYIAPYIELMNDWKIKPYSGSYTLSVLGNLFATGGASPFIGADSGTVLISMETTGNALALQTQSDSITDISAPVWDNAVGIIDAYQNGSLINVRWGHATDASGEVDYRVYISEVSGTVFNFKLGDFSGNMTSIATEFDGVTLLSEKTYYIGVRAIDKFGNETTNTNVATVVFQPVVSGQYLTAQAVWEYQTRTLTSGTGLNETELHNALDTYTKKDDWKADVSQIDLTSIPAAVWSYVSRELTVAAGLTPAQEAKLDQIIAQSISPDDVWNHTTRELTVPSGMTVGQEVKLDQILSSVSAISGSTNAIYNAIQTLPQMAEIRDEMVNVHFGKMEIDSVNKQISFFDKQNQMVAKFNVFDEHGNPSVTRVFKREVVV